MLQRPPHGPLGGEGVQHGQASAGADGVDVVHTLEVDHWVLVQVVEGDLGPIPLEMLLIVRERSIAQVELRVASSRLLASQGTSSNQEDDCSPTNLISWLRFHSRLFNRIRLLMFRSFDFPTFTPTVKLL